MKYIKISLVIIWMIVIFMFSNQKANESTNLSNSFIIKIVDVVEKITNHEFNNEEVINNFVYPVRKLAHFSIYFILFILTIEAIKHKNNAFIIAITICVLYSISDEIHQQFVDGRTGKIIDVFIDSIGSLINIKIDLFILKKIKNLK